VVLLPPSVWAEAKGSSRTVTGRQFCNWDPMTSDSRNELPSDAASAVTNWNLTPFFDEAGTRKSFRLVNLLSAYHVREP
jgi:hypothetical protein